MGCQVAHTVRVLMHKALSHRPQLIQILEFCIVCYLGAQGWHFPFSFLPFCYFLKRICDSPLGKYQMKLNSTAAGLGELSIWEWVLRFPGGRMPIASTQRQELGCTPHWRRLIGALYLQMWNRAWSTPLEGMGVGEFPRRVAGDRSTLSRLRTED